VTFPRLILRRAEFLATARNSLAQDQNSPRRILTATRSTIELPGKVITYMSGFAPHLFHKFWLTGPDAGSQTRPTTSPPQAKREKQASAKHRLSKSGVREGRIRRYYSRRDGGKGIF